MKKPYLCHSLYIDTAGLHWAGLSESGKTYQLAYREHLLFSKLIRASGGRGIDPLQGSAAASQIIEWMNSPEIKNAAVELAKRLPPKRAGVGLAFSETFSIFRFFTMPVVEKIYRKKAIPIEARKHIPFPLEECLYDWKAMEIQVDGKPMLGVLFAALRRDVLEASLALCAQAGLKPVFVDAPSLAASRAMEMVCALRQPPLAFSRENVLALYVDSEQIQLQFYSKAMPVLNRSIYLTEAAVRGSFLLERRKLDLEATLDFVKRQFGIERPDRVILFGASSLDKESLNNWASGLSEELGIKTEILPSLPAGADKDGKPQALTGWSELISLGAALRGVSHTLDSVELDLSAQLSAEPPQKAALKKIWAATAAVSVLFLSLAGWKAMQASELKSRLYSMRQSGSGAPELKGKTAQEIKALYAQRLAEITALRFLSPGSDQRIYVNQVLSDLAVQIPREAWIDSWGFRSELTGLGQPGSALMPRAALAWKGKTYVLDGQKDFALVNSFFKSLKEGGATGKLFPKADISIKREEGEQGSRPTLSFVMGFNTDAGAQ